MKHTALITGASGGLGEEFARLCAADGMDLILVARSEDKLRTLAAELEKTHRIHAHVIAVDLSEINSPQKVMEEIDARGIAVTMLINNAGFGSFGMFYATDMKDQRSMMQLNMIALMELTHLILPGMLQRKHGRILNIASTAAFEPGPLMSVYFATKAFVLNFSLALSNEMNDTGVTVTCLCPGPTKTGFEARASTLFRGHIMDAQTVARIGYSACKNGRSLVTAGLMNKILVFLVRFIPRSSAASIARKFQQK